MIKRCLECGDFDIIQDDYRDVECQRCGNILPRERILQQLTGELYCNIQNMLKCEPDTEEWAKAYLKVNDSMIEIADYSEIIKH